VRPNLAVVGNDCYYYYHHYYSYSLVVWYLIAEVTARLGGVRE
jgi:hypothetical protein